MFHFSQLKRKVGNKEVSALLFPFLQTVDQSNRYPVKIMDRKLAKKSNAAAVKILVQWSNATPEEATWEDYDELMAKFLEFFSTNP